jgi:SAM-dependent methyltransferase
VSRTGSYVTDIGYTAGFYPETAPAHLAFAALIAGRAPGGAARPERVLELGFGQGFGLALLAASNPDVVFEGCDFNAAHVAHARELIEAACLGNLAVTETSFEAAAAAPGACDADVVLLHGVMSWIAEDTRDAVLAILKHRMRSSAALYVSYNCLPGWAQLTPIRELILAIKRQTAGGSEQQIAQALNCLGALKHANAPFFAGNPVAAAHLETMLGLDRAYLAHEYLGDHAQPLQFADVAAQLSAVDLAYVASATLTENFSAFAMPANLQEPIARTHDGILRETIGDFAVGKHFRRDIFLRGDPALDTVGRRRSLAGLRFALAVPRRRLVFRFVGPLSELLGRDDFYAPIADMLADRIATFEELLDLPGFGSDAADRLIECLALLVHSGQILPLSAPPAVDTAPARRFNRLIVDRARQGHLYGYLASPVARSGIRVDDFALLTLAAVFDGKAETAAMAARHGLSIITALGRRPLDNGRPIESDDDAVAFLAARMEPVITEDIPLWRRLGML